MPRPNYYLDLGVFPVFPLVSKIQGSLPDKASICSLGIFKLACACLTARFAKVANSPIMFL